MVNGRTYGVEPSGRLYPISGPGFVELDRGAYKALGFYNDLRVTAEAEALMDLAGLSAESRRQARVTLMSR